ncbi:LuxR C-terminal-related transcriptional regulator [Kitasatospora sp. NPDC048239]|uniref:LuxR C-terminal-related transcriptional regulator n=1 Tax=Kitasatospora sp. NPDC048239 TaxID=3364046 RepID=UPI003715C775
MTTTRCRDDADLTIQERELIRQLAQGAKDEIAAKKLGIGRRTARHRMSELMTRLGARSRCKAGILAERVGWSD